MIELKDIIMITKISKLKNFGIFQDFHGGGDLPNFNKFNLIYGWNRSGKTTLSRIFASCEKRTIDLTDFKEYPENGEFEIQINDKNTLKSNDVFRSDLLIKVFNKDFVDKNISFDPSDISNPIFYISEIDIKTKQKLDALKQKSIEINGESQKAINDKRLKENRLDDFLKFLGREISNAIFDKAYNKKKAKDKINTIGVDKFADKILSDDGRKKVDETSKSKAKSRQDQLSIFNEKDVNDFQNIFPEIKEMLKKDVISEKIARLEDDSDINNWVGEGLDLHKSKEEEEKCLFCEKMFGSDYLGTLSKHFNEEYKILLINIKRMKNKIEEIRKEKILVKNDALYPDLKGRYESEANKLNECVKKTNAWVTEATEKLEEKHKNPFEIVENPAVPDDFLNLYNQIIEKLNKIIDEHNDKINNHDKEVLDAKQKIELDAIGKALEDGNYKKMATDFEQAKTKQTDTDALLNKNNEEIELLEQQLSNISEAVTEINGHLKSFFGREEIVLESDENKKGYRIKRDGLPAKSLSEGEKTAIAFSYFVATIKEQNFDKAKGIVFIDDPISSFDANFIYYCFSVIKVHFEEVGQVFISTHNFQFFNLVKEWFMKKNQNARRKEKKEPCEFFMVENFINAQTNNRRAKIAELDKTLRDYKSEYHFLFAKIKEFSEKEVTEYDDLYTIGNMVRRFFEIFVNFKIPTTGDLKSKMDSLIKNINDQGGNINIVEANMVYKLTNDFSHFDPTGGIEHTNKTEAKEASKILLKIIKESDRKHFELLEESISESTQPQKTT